MRLSRLQARRAQQEAVGELPRTKLMGNHENNKIPLDKYARRDVFILKVAGGYQRLLMVTSNCRG